MPYLPADLPFLDTAHEQAEFWAHCRRRRLMFQACGDCGRPCHPPLPICPGCQSAQRVWIAAPSAARLFSYTVVHHASHPAVTAHLPYNVALVEFPELPGVRLISNVIDAAAEALVVGMALELVWEDGPAGQPLPRFRRITSRADGPPGPS
jgi:uncharacterized OB-fold protein